MAPFFINLKQTYMYQQTMTPKIPDYRFGIKKNSNHNVMRPF